MAPPFASLREKFVVLYHGAQQAHAATCSRAVEKLSKRMLALCPSLLPSFAAWTLELSGGSTAALYFTHPCAFPTLMLPGWLEREITGSADATIQDELTYSSVCGYYAIRLIDDVMDRDPAARADLLPLVNVLNREFTGSYANLFRSEHPFWEKFDQIWATCNASAALDGQLKFIDEFTFRKVTAAKLHAAMIPMEAISQIRCGKELSRGWKCLVELLCCWHQLYNDLCDWQRDLVAGRVTWILSEAREKGKPHQSPAEWMMRTGVTWALGQLDSWMTELLTAADQLANQDLRQYLEFRRFHCADNFAAVQSALAAITNLTAEP